jgi:hypothetical protein
LVANAAIVGPKIIATAIIAAAVTIPSSVKAKIFNAHFAIAKAVTVKTMAMTKARALRRTRASLSTAAKTTLVQSYSFVILTNHH